MRTVKLVVIGASGVGKTSLRNQFISGRFTTGYRATIGADFITKTLPHYAIPDESVTLQIWDTAGQERFSSLSAAFFRGADAVLLLFDVNQPATLDALTKWWADFKDKAPVHDDQTDKFCCVFVGNKTDLTPKEDTRISELQASRFIDELIPPRETPPTPDITHFPPSRDPSPSIPPLQLNDSAIDSQTQSIDIGSPSHHQHHNHIHRGRQKRSSRSGSRSTQFRGGTIGTMATGHSIYHTPTSSLFDSFESARASPVPTSASVSSSPSLSPVRSPRRMTSLSSTSSAPTITPSLFTRGQAVTTPATACTTPSPVQPLPPPPERRPKLFFTSAKTGEGVSDVFEYVARRVVMRWEYDEAVEARTLHMQEASGDGTIRLNGPSSSIHSVSSFWRKSSCCNT